MGGVRGAVELSSCMMTDGYDICHPLEMTSSTAPPSRNRRKMFLNRRQELDMPQDLFAETLAITGLGELAERRCGALSGGRPS
jgi:hypothetical protein